MLPLSHDIRRYYRKHATGTVVSDSGAVRESYTVDGPYSLAFRPGGESRTFGEQGYTHETENYLVIADGCKNFHAGDILTGDAQGNDELFKVDVVKNWPTEQTMYVRGL